MLGVEFPICAFSHCRDVVAAVTNAGGFGILGATAHSPARLRSELTWIEQQTGGKPLRGRPAAAAQIRRRRAGRDRHQPGPDPAARGASRVRRRPAGPLRRDGARRGRPPVRGRFEHLAQELPAAARRGLRPRHPADRQRARPTPADLVERAHDAGVLVAALAGTTRHAQRHAAAGVDLIVAQGTEAGGHTGEVATMVLVPEVVDAVAPVPVLAAGGSPAAARSRRRWRWAPRACGAGRCG